MIRHQIEKIQDIFVKQLQNEYVLEYGSDKSVYVKQDEL